MSTFLTEEQEMIRDTARRFAQTEVEKYAVDMDLNEELPEALIRQCGELGFYGLMIPEEYGGSDLGLSTACLVLEEIAKTSPAFAGLLNVNMVLTPVAVALVGTDEQKKRFLVPAATGEETIAYSQSEPSGSTDYAGFQTTLTSDGDDFRLDGVKLFCSQGAAKRVMVIAKTNIDNRPGIGCVMVDFDADGVEAAPHEDKLGWRGTNTGTVNFNNVFVPRENLLGSPNSAHVQLLTANRTSAVGHSSTSLGALKGLFDKTADYVKERDIYGKNMSCLQPVGYWLAQARCHIFACESMIRETSRQFDEGRGSELESSMCKAYVCDTAFESSSKLLQIWGGNGMMNSTGINRYMRDARVNMVAEGSSEVYYDVIAARALERPSYFEGWCP